LKTFNQYLNEGIGFKPPDPGSGERGNFTFSLLGNSEDDIFTLKRPYKAPRRTVGFFTDYLKLPQIDIEQDPTKYQQGPRVRKDSPFYIYDSTSYGIKVYSILAPNNNVNTNNKFQKKFGQYLSELIDPLKALKGGFRKDNAYEDKAISKIKKGSNPEHKGKNFYTDFKYVSDDIELLESYFSKSKLDLEWLRNKNRKMSFTPEDIRSLNDEELNSFLARSGDESGMYWINGDLNFPGVKNFLNLYDRLNVETPEDIVLDLFTDGISSYLDTTRQIPDIIIYPESGSEINKIVSDRIRERNKDVQEIKGIEAVRKVLDPGVTSLKRSGSEIKIANLYFDPDIVMRFSPSNIDSQEALNKLVKKFNANASYNPNFFKDQSFRNSFLYDEDLQIQALRKDFFEQMRDIFDATSKREIGMAKKKIGMSNLEMDPIIMKYFPDTGYHGIAIALAVIAGKIASANLPKAQSPWEIKQFIPNIRQYLNDLYGIKEEDDGDFSDKNILIVDDTMSEAKTTIKLIIDVLKQRGVNAQNISCFVVAFEYSTKDKY